MPIPRLGRSNSQTPPLGVKQWELAASRSLPLAKMGTLEFRDGSLRDYFPADFDEVVPFLLTPCHLCAKDFFIGSHDRWRAEGVRSVCMNSVLKQVSIAVGLIVFCVLVLAATKNYGVWVITSIAVFLVLLGFLRKDRSPDPAGKDDEALGKPAGDESGPGEAPV